MTCAITTGRQRRTRVGDCRRRLRQMDRYAVRNPSVT